MRRGVYFDAWFKDQHNYHPSLPARRLRMVEQLADMRATTLCWSALGGGSIALPYLEQEAYQQVPARFRLHGHVNDAEFLAACAARGIEVFGVIFEAQGWRFAAEYDQDGLLASVNETRGVGRPGSVGLTAFNQDTGPSDWLPWRHYFPDGLHNSLGEEITDLFEQACSRRLDGEPLHANWVEVADRDQTAHLMDRNSPAWLEYLKAIARIQIDAGVSGIQLDESEIPLNALYYGGCFCPDCTVQFRQYLQGLDPATLPPELQGTDLSAFDYGAWLRAQGYQVYTPVRELPLVGLYAAFMLGAMHRTFRDLSAYIKAYGRSKGKNILVSGNFYNGHPEYDGIVDAVDLCITEMHATGYQQPWFFRHVQGLARGREVLIAENPYGGIIPELVQQLETGRGYDRLRTSFYEGAATGPSMTFPFGSWMGTVIQDSFWAPKALLDEVGQALAATDHLRGVTSRHEVAVLYPLADAWAAEVTGPRWATAGAAVDYAGVPDDQRIPYHGLIKQLALAHVPFDMIPLPDPAYRANDVTAASLARYRYVLAPACARISPAQHDELAAYAAAGGTVVVYGDYGTALPDSARAGVPGVPGWVAGDLADPTAALADLQVEPAAAYPDLYLGLFDLGPGRSAVHLVNYAYDQTQDVTPPRHGLTFQVRLPHAVGAARLWRPGHPPQSLTVGLEADRVAIKVPELDIYAIVELTQES
ncbi:MAG: hypothetical protein LBR19_01670 [Bifidobacteriaceae bacterium]|jgi:hypothetical protein|nr:hypothetical protein [Bifidobacteriaceae bacterium]